MSQERWTAIDALFSALAPVDAALAAADDPAAVASNQGRLLEILARAVGARRVLEIGTGTGYSTLWLARAVGADGLIVTVELDASVAAQAAAAFRAAGVAERVELLVGDARELLPGVAGSFDLVFIDADKRSNPAYLDRALRLSRPGTLIVADNVVRGGAVLDSPDEHAEGARRFLELLAAEPRVVATALQTVGVKGWDGFALALVVA